MRLLGRAGVSCAAGRGVVESLGFAVVSGIFSISVSIFVTVGRVRVMQDYPVIAAVQGKNVNGLRAAKSLRSIDDPKPSAHRNGGRFA
jgi:hypothetical protein